MRILRRAQVIKTFDGRKFVLGRTVDDEIVKTSVIRKILNDVIETAWDKYEVESWGGNYSVADHSRARRV